MEEVDEDSHCKGGDSKARGWKGGKGTVLWPKKGLDSTVEHETPPTGALPYNTVPTVASLALVPFVGVESGNINNPEEGWEWPYLMYDTNKQ